MFWEECKCKGLEIVIGDVDVNMDVDVESWADLNMCVLSGCILMIRVTARRKRGWRRVIVFVGRIATCECTRDRNRGRRS